MVSFIKKILLLTFIWLINSSSLPVSNEPDTVFIDFKTSKVEIGAVKIKDFDPSLKAFLDTLAAAEGTSIAESHCWKDSGYLAIVGCSVKKQMTFDSFDSHPEKKLKLKSGIRSDAAGRYQMLSKTWNWVAPKIEAEDFSPENQDLAAAWLIEYRGAINIIKQIGSGSYWHFLKAISLVNKEWASLPGSPYGQRTHSAKDLWKVYKKAYLHYK